MVPFARGSENYYEMNSVYRGCSSVGMAKRKGSRGSFSSVTSWLPCGAREATATEAKLGTQGEWFHSLEEVRIIMK